MRRLELMTVIAVAVLGLWPRATVIIGDAETLVRVVPDDAFYYFETARRIADGQGSTFDGLHPTDGYHPLWMALLLPAAVLDEPLTLPRVALGLCLMLNSLTTIVLYAVLRRVTARRWISLAGASIYFLLPPIVAASLNGLETSLATALFAVAFYVTVMVHSRSAWYDIGVGALLGLLFLARTDMVFAIAAFWLITFARSAPALRWRRGLLMPLAASVIAAPWLLWNWINFGSIVQVSGLAVPYVIHEVYWQENHTAAEFLAQSARYFVAFMLVGPPYWWTFGGTVVAAVLQRGHARRSRSAHNVRLLHTLYAVLLLWLSGICQIFIHLFVRWYPRAWYFDQLNWLLVLTIGLIVSAVASVGRRSAIEPPSGRQRSNSPGLINVVGVALIIASAVGLWLLDRELLLTGPYPWQVEMLDAAAWLRANLRNGETAAAFNAGVMGYFSGAPVVNLDGVINNAAYDAIRNRDLGELMRQSAVRYYLDYDPVMLMQYRSFLGEPTSRLKMSVVTVIDRPGVAWLGANLVVYRLDWANK